MIPQETIEQIRQASDIAQVIGEFLRLKKRGKRFLALCPFHTEKTPSFSISPDRQMYHCFGCGKGGNVITFLMEHEKMSFVEAVRYLARKANIVIREERRDDAKREVLDRIAYANHVAIEYFQETLLSSRYRKILNDYLKTKRGISDESIETFRLGLAGEDWDGLLRRAASKDLTGDDLDRAGLAILSEKTNKHFDRFRQRLMIPILSLSSKPIAFGGRTLKKGEPAKYINSPETLLYTKGNVLYGLNIARDDIRQSRSVFVVEGYFDVISLWQIGVKNVVASSGTAFSAQQARLLARFAENVYLFFDADSAGRKAALRSVDALYDAGLEVKVMVTPEGEDPDSIANKFGPDKIDELKHDALDFIPFRISDVDVQKTGIIGKEKLVKEFAALGAKIADPTRRSLFLTEAADALRVDEGLMRTSAPTRDESASSATPPRKKYNPVEYEFVSILFNNPGSIDSIFETISQDDFDSKELSRLYSALVQQYRDAGSIDAGKLIDSSRDDSFISLVTEVAHKEWDAAEVSSETQRLVNLILNEKRKRIRKRLQNDLAQAESDGDQDKANRILEEMKTYGL